MPLEVRIEVPPEEEGRNFDRGFRAGLGAAAKQWQREFAERHFEPFAAAKYGYRRRTEKYNARKRRRFGHEMPLVWTGTTHEWVTTRFQEPTVRRSGESIRARLQIKAPTYFYAFHGKHQYDKVEELLRTTPDEYRRMQGTIEEMIDEALARRRGGRRGRREQLA